MIEVYDPTSGGWVELPYSPSVSMRRYKTCTVKASSELAYVLYNEILRRHIKPARETIYFDYSGEAEWMVRIDGADYALRVEYVYINSCFDNPNIAGFIEKGKVITLRRQRKS